MYAFSLQLSSHMFMTNRAGSVSPSAPNFEPIPNQKRSRVRHVLAAEAGCHGYLRSGLTFAVNSDLQNNSEREGRAQQRHSSKGGPCNAKF